MLSAFLFFLSLPLLSNTHLLHHTAFLFHSTPSLFMSSRLGDWLLAVAAEMPFETDWETSLNGSW